tara:strand:+ start:1089 stop:2336 length:1248 start_codon:yes stop_codon:yes gene_type:complete
MFLNSRNQKSLITNSFYLYLSHFADYLLALFFLPFIATKLGAFEFGKIGVLQTFGILIVLVMEFGSTLIATREVARLRDNKKELKTFVIKITTFKILLIPLVLIISMLVTIFIPFFFKNQIYFIITVLGSVFQGVAPTWYFQGLEKMKKIALTKIIFRLIGFLLILIFVKSSNDGWIVLTAFSSSSFLICLYLYYSITNEFESFRFIKTGNLKEIFNKSIFSFLITVIPVIYLNVSIIIMSIFVNPIQLGYYFVASRIYRAFNTLFGPISQAFLPIISSLEIKNKIESKLLIKKYLFLMILLGLSFFILNFFGANFLIINFFGYQYSSSIDLLKLFSFILPLTAISNTLGRQWLIALDKEYYYFQIQLISSILGFVIFILFIKSLEVKSFILSLIFYELTSIIMTSVFLFKNIKR